MDGFVVDVDATYILLGRDHPCVKAWITRKPITEADEVPVPLAAITRAQSQAWRSRKSLIS